MFALTADEAQRLISQTVISNARRGGRRKTTYAFTEQGVAMLSSVLRSQRAVQVNIAVMRAFVSLRGLLATDDEQFAVVFEAIRLLIEAPSAPDRRMGFRAGTQKELTAEEAKEEVP